MRDSIRTRVALAWFVASLVSPCMAQSGNGTVCSELLNSATLTPDLTLRWVVNIPDDGSSAGTLSAELVYRGKGWLGMAVSNDGEMVGSEAVIGLPDEGNSHTNPGKYKLGGKFPSSLVSLMPPSQQTLIDSNVTQTDTRTVLTFTKLLSEPGEIPIDGNGPNTFLWAVGEDNDLRHHKDRNSFPLTLEPCTADGRGAGKMGSAESVDESTSYQKYFKAHGVLAFIGWGVLTPIAISAALLRGFVSRGVLWFRLHMALNVMTLVVTAVAVILAVVAIDGEANMSHLYWRHNKVGIAMFVFLTLQVVGGAMRPHIGETPASDEGEWGAGATPEPSDASKSRARMLWEFGHRLIGGGLFCFGLWQLQSGMNHYNSMYSSGSLTTAFWVYMGTGIGVVVLLKAFEFYRNHRAETKLPVEETVI